MFQYVMNNEISQMKLKRHCDCSIMKEGECQKKKNLAVKVFSPIITAQALQFSSSLFFSMSLVRF